MTAATSQVLLELDYTHPQSEKNHYLLTVVAPDSTVQLTVPFRFHHSAFKGVAISLNNLAEVYELQGKYEEAESFYKQSLEMNKKFLGQEHRNTQGVSINLQHCLQKKDSQPE